MKIEDVLRQLFEGERQRSIAIVCPHPLNFEVFKPLSAATRKFLDEENENIYRVFPDVNPRGSWGGIQLDAVVFYNAPFDSFAMTKVRSHKTLPKNSVVMLHEQQGQYFASVIDTRCIEFKENNNEK